MKTSIPPTPHCLRLFTIWLFAMLFHAVPAWSQTTPVGGTARPFTVTNLETGQPIRMTDFAGKVLVLDFFAYWCGPCQTSSPDLETNVQEYYAARGGNANGVPVQVLAVSVDDSNPTATDAFIAKAGLKLAGEDPMTAAGAYQQFSTGGIPLFVIINGVDGSPSHTQYEVIYKRAGYAGAPALRAVIDQVMPAETPAEAQISVVAPGGGPITNNGPAIGMGNFLVGASGKEQTFTISNTGGATLTGIAVTKDGAQANDFTLNTSLTALSLEKGATTTFKVTFGPTAAGFRRAVIQIASSDTTANPFNIQLTGSGTSTDGFAPLIEVKNGKAPLTFGSAVIEFGDADYGSAVVKRSIVIGNRGNAPLTRIVATIQGTNASDFEIIGTPPSGIPAGKNTTFTLLFEPTASGLRSATLRITSNDATQSPFDIQISGNGTGEGKPPEAEISLTQGRGAGSNLVSGKSIRNLGARLVGKRGEVMTFTITNTGLSDLKMLRVNFQGQHQNEFILMKDVNVRSLAPGKTTTFKIALQPGKPGVRKTTLQVFSNDKDENPFSVKLIGLGKRP